MGFNRRYQLDLEAVVSHCGADMQPVEYFPSYLDSEETELLGKTLQEAGLPVVRTHAEMMLITAKAFMGDEEAALVSSKGFTRSGGPRGITPNHGVALDYFTVVLSMPEEGGASLFVKLEAAEGVKQVVDGIRGECTDNNGANCLLLSDGSKTPERFVETAKRRRDAFLAAIP